VTDAAPLRVNVQVLRLLPPLDHAPDQTASRPLVTLNVIDVPVANDADPVLPTDTLIPAGLEVTRSPLRPVALTVSVALCPAGPSVSVAVRVTPAALAVIVTGVDVVTLVVVIVKVALVAPCATVTLAGVAAAALLSDSETANPPDGAAAVNVTVPCDELPPTTDAGLTDTAESAAGTGVPDALTVNAAVRVTPPNDAENVTVNEPPTARVVMVNVALVAPAATVR